MSIHERRSTDTNRRSSCLASLALAGFMLAGAALPPAGNASEIVDTRVEGDQLVVEMELSGTETAWQLMLLGGGGEIVATVDFFAPAGSVEALAALPLGISGVAERGWQHSLELVGSDGTVADQENLHLGLVCSPDLAECELYLRRGLRVDGGLYATPEMGDYLDELRQTPGAILDLNEVMQARPELGGITIQILIESGRLLGPSTGCQCLFAVQDPGGSGLAHSVAWFDSSGGPYAFTQELATGPSLLMAGFSTQRTTRVELQCFQGLGSSLREVSIAGHSVLLEIPTWAPCESPCSGSVAWTLGELAWRAILDSTEHSTVSGGFDLAWELGDTLLTSHQDSRSAWGLRAAPAMPSGSVPILPKTVMGEAPSALTVEGQAWVEVRDWLEGETPQGQMTAGAPITAYAQAQCAPAASLTAEPTVWGAGMEPSVIKLVVGPVDP